MKRQINISSIIAGIIPLIIGILVIIGWYTHNDFLTTIIPGAAVFKFNTAICFVLAAASLLLYLYCPENKTGYFIRTFFAIIVSLIGVLTLTEYLLGINIGIDELFIKDPARSSFGFYAGRMSVISAVNFTLTGIGLVLLNKEKFITYHFFYIIAISFTSLFILVGLNFIPDIPKYIPLAIHSAISFIFLSLAIWLAQPALKQQFNFERRLFLGLTAAIVLIIGISVFFFYYNIKRVQSASLVTTTNNALRESDQTLSLAKDIGSGLTHYIITNDSSYLENYIIAKNNIYDHIDNLKNLTKSSAVQQRRIDSLASMVNKRIAITEQVIQFKKENNLQAANQLLASGLDRIYISKIRKIITQLQQDENTLLTQQQRINDKSIASYNRVFFIFLTSIFILLVIIFAGIRRNIILRKKAEATLKKGETSFQLMVNSVKDYAIFLLDIEGRVASWNSGAEHIKGYNAKEIIGKPIDNFYTKEDRENGIPKNNLRMAFEYGHFETEGWRIRKDGSAFYADIVFTSLIDDEGKLYGYAKVTRDITEKRKAAEALNNLNAELEQRVKERTEEIQKKENHYRSLIENSNDIIGLLSSSLDPIYRSPSAKRITGWTDEEIAKETIAKLVHPDDKEKFTAIIKETLENPGKDIKIFYRFKHKNGHYVYLDGVMTNLLHDENLRAILFNSRDVTEKIEAEKSLAFSEKRFRILIENNFDMIGMMDTSLKVIYRSPSSSRITGWSDEEFERMGMEKIIHPDDKEKIAIIIKEVMTNPGKRINISYRGLHKKGHYLYMEGTMINLLNDENIKAVVFNFRDVTARIEAEEELIKRERRFRDTLDNMLEGIQIHDFNWNYIYINDAAIKNSIYPKEELLGRTLMEKYPGIEQTDAFKAMQRCMYERVSSHLEIEFVFPDGSKGDFELTIHPVPEGIFVISINITERKIAEEKIKTSEEHYRMLFNQTPNGIFLANDKGYYIDVNTAACNMMGYTREKMATMHLTEVLAEEELPRLPEQIKKLESGEVVTSQWKFKRRDNSVFEGELIGRKLPDGNLQGILRDVTIETEAKNKIQNVNTELEQRVNKRTEELQKANFEIEAFSYSISHDLRAPLRGIIGFTSILEEDYTSKLDDEAKRITSIIRNNTVKMGNLIDDLLTFSRVGKHDITKSKIDTNKMVRDCIEQLSNSTKINKNIQWNIGALQLTVADIGTIRQVWTNLISNAIKYSATSSNPIIEIGSFQNDDTITYYVKDNGVGFDEKYKNKLFRVFQRLHSANEFEGTGIGLAIVEKIISKHDGNVWAEGEVNKGACFYFSLPS